jgi:hypothetical protein
VALKLREIFPAVDRHRLMNKVTVDFIDRLVAKTTQGFQGDVGVVPRQFLRQFVNVLDLTDENEDYDPMVVAGFDKTALNEIEQRLSAGLPYLDPEPEDDKGYAIVEF